MTLGRALPTAALLSAISLPPAAVSAPSDPAPSSSAADNSPQALHQASLPGGQSRTGETWRYDLQPDDEAAALSEDGEIADYINRRVREDRTLQQERLLVDVENGVAFLSGWVASAEEEQRLYAIIAEVPAVDRIESALVVDPHAARASEHHHPAG